MKTSWKKTKQWDAYLQQQAPPEEALVTEAELLLNPDLPETLQWQRRTYALIQQYGRQQLQQEIQAAHHRVFYHPEHRGFRHAILQLFTKS